MDRGRRRSRSPTRRRDEDRHIRDRRGEERRDCKHDEKPRHKSHSQHRRDDHVSHRKQTSHRHDRRSDTGTDSDTGTETSYDSEEERRQRRKKRHRHERDRKERRKKKKKERRRERTPSSEDESTEHDSDDYKINQSKLDKLNTQAITDKDYFAKSTEFRVWLREKKRLYFDDLKSSEAHKHFSKFIRAWNRGQLDQKYYTGIRSSQLNSSDLTKYKWSFATKVNQDEVLAIRDTVDTATNSERMARDFAQKTQGHRESNRIDTPDKKGRQPHGIGPTMPSLPGNSTSYGSASNATPMPVGPYGEVMDNEDRRRYERGLQRKDTKNYKKSREADLEELAPKATGREAMIEKRRARSAYLHREPSPDVELSESDLMGGGDSYQAHLQSLEQSRIRRMQHKQEVQTHRGSEMNERMVAHQRKEQATMDMFRQLVEQRQQRELQPRSHNP